MNDQLTYANQLSHMDTMMAEIKEVVENPKYEGKITYAAVVGILEAVKQQQINKWMD